MKIVVNVNDLTNLNDGDAVRLIGQTISFSFPTNELIVKGLKNSRVDQTATISLDLVPPYDQEIIKKGSIVDVHGQQRIADDKNDVFVVANKVLLINGGVLTEESIETLINMSSLEGI